MSTKAERTDLDCPQRQLAGFFERWPHVRRYRIAFSGGLDSTVLLHLCARLHNRVTAKFDAVHVDHALHPESARWSRHCEIVCDRLGIPLVALKISARAAQGESPEAAARSARYAAMAALIEAGDCLLTAHHEDDQAETVLLQLLRGAGPHGLAAMPFIESFAAGWHARPLLGCTREAIRRTADAEELQWIDDPSNADTGLRRNYVRHEIMPRLKARWPAAARTLSRSATHSASAARMLDTLAEQDLAVSTGNSPGTLSATALTGLNHDRQSNALRMWLHRLGLPLPSTTHLEHLRDDVLAAGPDANPLLAWPGAEIRRFRDDVYGMRPLAPHDPAVVLPWDARTMLLLPDGGHLIVTPATRSAMVMRPFCATEGPVSVRFRRGGMRCRPAGRGQSHTLKNLLQDAGIPPWLRERVPLVYVGDTLAAVAGVCICEGWQSGPGEDGLEVVWEPNSYLLDAEGNV